MTRAQESPQTFTFAPSLNLFRKRGTNTLCRNVRFTPESGHQSDIANRIFVDRLIAPTSPTRMAGVGSIFVCEAQEKARIASATAAPVICVSNPASVLLRAPQSCKDRRPGRKCAISAPEFLR
jgi:hypothetical protein